MVKSPGVYADSHQSIQYLHQNTKIRPSGSQNIHCELRRHHTRSPNHRSNHQSDLWPSADYEHCRCWAEERNYLSDMDTLKKVRINIKNRHQHRCNQLTADTLSFVSATLTDTCDVTGAADDTVLTCCLTIVNTAHFWISKSFPVQKPFWVCTYAQARGDPEFPETFLIALDHAKEAKKGLNLFKTISSLFLRVCYLKPMKDFDPNRVP